MRYRCIDKKNQILMLQLQLVSEREAGREREEISGASATTLAPLQLVLLSTVILLPKKEKG
jgi:hypothetical protein